MDIKTIVCISDAFVHINGEAIYKSLSHVIGVAVSLNSEFKRNEHDIAHLRKVLNSGTPIVSDRCPSALFWDTVGINRDWSSLFDIMAHNLGCTSDTILHESFLLFVRQLLLDPHTIINHPGFSNPRSFVTCGPIVNLLASSIRDVAYLIHFGNITSPSMMVPDSNVGDEPFDNTTTRTPSESRVSEEPFICRLRH